jgi:hypothetical protein
VVDDDVLQRDETDEDYRERCGMRGCDTLGFIPLPRRRTADCWSTASSAAGCQSEFKFWIQLPNWELRIMRYELALRRAPHLVP